MRLKSELYKKEQEEIVDKIISILDLENRTEYTLYELDKNEEIQKKIMELIPEIRKYYSFNGIKAVGEPNKIKRPWLSIIKHLIKKKYNIEYPWLHIISIIVAFILLIQILPLKGSIFQIHFLISPWGYLVSINMTNNNMSFHDSDKKE